VGGKLEGLKEGGKAQEGEQKGLLRIEEKGRGGGVGFKFFKEISDKKKKDSGGWINRFEVAQLGKKKALRKQN